MGSVCNLVGEFNGLVSTEGSAFAGPLVFYKLLYHFFVFCVCSIDYLKQHTQLHRSFRIKNIPQLKQQVQVFIQVNSVVNLFLITTIMFIFTS